MNPLMLTLLVGIFILFGTLIGIYTTNKHKFVDFSIGGAFGVIVSLIVMELIPEAYEHLEFSSNVRTVIMLIIMSAVGFMLMQILDKFVPYHEHEDEHHHQHTDDTCHNEHLGHVGVLATTALFIHNLIEGMTLYATALSSIHAGYLLCVGIGLHNIPMGIVVANMLKDKKKSLIATFILIFSTFVGGIIMSVVSPLNDFVIGILIALTLGMLIYLVTMELFGQMRHSKDKVMTIIGVVVGLLIIFLSVTLGGHHH